MRQPNRIESTWQWHLDASCEALWPYVSDTDRFNADAGLPPVRRLATPHKIGHLSALGAMLQAPGGVWIESKAGPFRLRWREEAFEWVQAQGFGVTRHYIGGPLRRLSMRLNLAPEGNGSRLSYHVEVVARWDFLAPAIKAALEWAVKPRFRRAFEKAAQRANNQAPLPVTLAPGGRERLRHRLRGLQNALQDGHAALAIERIGLWLSTADDEAVARIRPYAHAATWGVDWGAKEVGLSSIESKRRALVLCLQATKVGLLTMRWEPICPYCRGPKEVAESLAGLRSSVHCDACGIDFKTDLNRSVEVTFRAHPALRPIERGLFCVGSPARTPHIVLQRELAAAQKIEVGLDLAPGRYRLRSQAVPGGLYLRVDAPGDTHLESKRDLKNNAERNDRPLHDCTPPIELTLTLQGWDKRESHLPTQACLALVNATNQAAPFILERMAHADDAAMASDLLCLQSFHDLFGTETLGAGEEIAVGQMAFLFTDLKGSTRLYREVGDAKAFARVMEHFSVLQKAIAESGGTVVKTIGDAVMAAFTEPEAALVAAQRGRDALKAAGIEVVLKSGVHCGPCIAVTQNDRLDYFGSTLNLAARLLEHCQGDDLVLSQAAAEDPGVVAWLAAQKHSHLRAPQPIGASLRGFEGETHRLLRWAWPAPVTKPERA
jgi:class 3 adenylate cyclase